jgi:hypothetical protein
MDDPSDEKAHGEVSQFSGLPVRAMIAPPTDIRSAIRAYYGAGQDASSLSEAMAEADAVRASTERQNRRSSLPAPAPAAQDVAAAPAPAAVDITNAPAPAAAPPVHTEPLEGPDSGPEIEVSEIPMPRRGRGKGPRMVTLTLLDGTKVNLPAKSAPAKKRLPSDPPIKEPPNAAAAEGQLTARDLVAALRALSHGADATEILGENVRWEALFSALLSLMLKKHLIADWEFVEEYKKT